MCVNLVCSHHMHAAMWWECVYAAIHTCSSVLDAFVYNGVYQCIYMLTLLLAYVCMFLCARIHCYACKISSVYVCFKLSVSDVVSGRGKFSILETVLSQNRNGFR